LYAQVTSGVGTDEVLMTPTKLKTAIVAHAPASGDTLPAQVTSAEKTARTETALRSFSPKDIAELPERLLSLLAGLVLLAYLLGYYN
jgi:hypothetical protein